MKKAEDYLDKLYITQDGEPTSVHDSTERVVDLIKQIQIDTIDETIKLCVEKAEIAYQSFFFKDGEKCLFKADTYVNPKSIKDCAEILKSEL